MIGFFIIIMASLLLGGAVLAYDRLIREARDVKKDKASEFFLENQRLMKVLYMVGGLALVYFVLIFWR